MKLKKAIIIQVNNVDSRRRISEALKISDQMLYIHLRANKENGRLTKMNALVAISKEVKKSVSEITEGAAIGALK